MIPEEKELREWGQILQGADKHRFARDVTAFIRAVREDTIAIYEDWQDRPPESTVTFPEAVRKNIRWKAALRERKG